MITRADGFTGRLEKGSTWNVLFSLCSNGRGHTLLVAEGEHWIEVGGSAGRNITGEKRCGAEECAGDAES